MKRIRSASSSLLDNTEVTVRTGRGVEQLTIPPALPWDDVYDYLARNWKVGQHMALIGKNGSGKTTFAREALMLRDWVVVLATKVRDKDLYEEFGRLGYVVKHEWSPHDTEDNRVIFAPPLPSPDLAGRKVQAEAFRKVLLQLFQLRHGNWTVYADEIAYITNDLGLKTEWDTLELQGRALGLTLVSSTQRPRRVPVSVFSEAYWFGFWRMPRAEDRVTASELVGEQQYVARESMRLLPPHEMLLVDTARDVSLRTKVYV